jgi:hypothetical protein
LLGCLLRPGQPFDLEASEMFLRDSLHAVGAQVLGRVLNRARGAEAAAVKCAAGHEAVLVDYRRKRVTTVLGPIRIKRAYYYCAECRQGLVPQDVQLDIKSTSFSPGVRKMMGHVGGSRSFKGGRADLEALAGIKVQIKAVERVAERLGQEVEAFGQRERRLAVADNVVPLKKVPIFYVSFDGTGAPMVKRETAGRRGKGESGQAHTREVKLGCIFTQTRVDEEGRPQRDEASTSYVGAIETAEEFGARIYGEAERRGLRRAAKVIVIGDGAPWVWALADEHFPGAVQIVDLYHAREHLAELSRIIYGQSSKGTRWCEQRTAQLDEGKVELVLRSLRRLRPVGKKAKEELRKTINYFEHNRERMPYGQFRRQGWFVGSGVVEAGCRTVVGQRLKQSGMHWSRRGANAIIALRCIQLSGRWEEFWEMRATG